MSNKNIKTGVGWGFLLVFIGLGVLILDGLDVKGRRVSFDLDNANPEVLAIASALMLGGAGLRVFPEKAGEVLPDSKAIEALGKAITGDKKTDESS